MIHLWEVRNGLRSAGGSQQSPLYGIAKSLPPVAVGSDGHPVGWHRNQVTSGPGDVWVRRRRVDSLRLLGYIIYYL